MSLYDFALDIHLAALGLAAIGILYADSLAFSWIRGKKDRLLKEHITQAHHLVSVALALIIASGIYMFWPQRVFLLAQPFFLLKMFFVLVLVINSYFIGRMMHIARLTSYRSLTISQKMPLAISGAVSLICWIGAGITALILFG